jgi:hypothetical protein
MHRTVVTLLFSLVVWLPAGFAFGQQAPPRPAELARPGVVPPGDEIKLDETSALKASAVQSKMSAVLANFALLQRQAQDLQSEMTRALDERKRLLEEAGRKARVEVREPNDWVYDEAGLRYFRPPKK